MDTFLSKSYSPKVTVVCLTYNQEKYILDAMNGFSMQETTFPFVCVIMDDASTDGEQNVIRTYLQSEFEMDNAEHVSIPESEVIVCRHRNNLNCFFAVYLLKKNLWHTGKKDPLIDYWKQQSEYVAHCEGDDYWTDPLKLQKQVDFLEGHLEYGFIGTRCRILQAGYIKDDIDWFKDVDGITDNGIRMLGNVFEYAKCGPVARTCSLLYRRCALSSVAHVLCGDLSLEAVLAHDTLFAMLESVSCVYRIHSNGLSHPSSLATRLRYISWQEANRKLLHELYPDECEYSEVYFQDKTSYEYLKDAILHFKLKDAIDSKRAIITREYKYKFYSRFFIGPISFMVLYFLKKMRDDG